MLQFVPRLGSTQKVGKWEAQGDSEAGPRSPGPLFLDGTFEGQNSQGTEPPMGTGDGNDPRSPANRGWGWGWTPEPRQIGDGDGDRDRGPGFRALAKSDPSSGLGRVAAHDPCGPGPANWPYVARDTAGPWQ
jgi:hypothetical protein